MESTTVEVFRAQLAIDEFMPIESLWTFRVYDGSTLHVEVTRPEAPVLPPGLTEERFAQELQYSYIAYDCTASQLLPSVNSSEPATYMATFLLVKQYRPGENWTINVTATLCPVSGVNGTWAHVASTVHSNTIQSCAHETINESALWRPEVEASEGRLVSQDAASWQTAIEPVRVTLAPLTRGLYSLTGSLIDDSSIGFIMPLTFHVKLLPGGQLIGTSETGGREPGDAPEIAHLTGSWTLDAIDFIQEYRCTDGPSEVFAFHGHASRFGIRGEWVVEQIVDWEHSEDSDRLRFDARVTWMRRRWSPEEHALFPASFREAARLCLLSSLRAKASKVSLPSVLWPCVLSFCDSQWFIR